MSRASKHFVGALARSLTVGLLCAVVAGRAPLFAQATPLTLAQAERALLNDLPQPRLVGLARDNCLAFSLTGAVVARLTRAGATQETVDALRDVCSVLPNVATVRFASPPDTLIVDRVVRLSLALLDGDGREVLAAQPVEWSVSDASVLGVSSEGELTALSPGSAVVTVEIEGLRTSHTVAVVAAQVPELVAIELSATELSLDVGASIQLVAQPLGPDGERLSTPVRFSSAVPRVLSVSSGGVLRGLEPGHTVVRVTSEHVSELVRVEVVRPRVMSVSVTPTRSVVEIGGRATLSAQALSPDGSVLADRPLAWSSSDLDVLSVTSDGALRGLRPGLVVLSVASEGAVAQAQVRVLPRVHNLAEIITSGLVVPGWSQLRVGRPARAMLTLLAVGGAVAWGYLSEDKTEFCASPLGAGATCRAEDVLSRSADRPKLVAGIGAGAALMILSALDAGMHGRSLNRAAAEVRAQPWAGVSPVLGLGSDGAVHASWGIPVR